MFGNTSTADSKDSHQKEKAQNTNNTVTNNHTPNLSTMFAITPISIQSVFGTDMCRSSIGGRSSKSISPSVFVIDLL